MKESFKTKSFRAGGYSILAACIVIAIAIIINIIVGQLPEKYTKIDNTANQLFTISEQTKQMVSGLTDDITIYWIVREGNEDATLKVLLDRYKELSSRITIVKKDPIVYPSFATKYSDNVQDNSVVVELGEKYKYVGYNEIYEYDTSSYYTTGSYDVSFAGEGAITSAIDYVLSDNLPKMYLIKGHGEYDLSVSFANSLSKQNIETSELSLINIENIPDDADIVLINAPRSDISDKEKDMLSVYLKSGGSMILLTDAPEENRLANIDSLMSEYGVSAVDGIVIENDQNYYAYGTQYLLIPSIESHAITQPLIDGRYFSMLSLAQGLNISEELPENVTVQSLLNTSDKSYSKLAGYKLSTYDKEDGDIDGPFSLAVAITDTLEDGSESKIVWYGSGALLDDSMNNMVSGGNEDMILNTVSWMCPEKSSDITIHSKSLSAEYLTIKNGDKIFFIILTVGIIPLAYLIIGIVRVVKRKKK